MRLRTTFVILALAADTSLGQATDPLKSPGCVEALDALQAREAALLSAGTTHSAAAQRRSRRPWSPIGSGSRASASARKIS
jgi:hypothetical protein